MRRILKDKKGSISLFVLLSCLFFLVTVTSVAVSMKNKERSIDMQYAKTKASYEKDVGKEESIYIAKIDEIERNSINKLIVDPNGGRVGIKSPSTAETVYINGSTTYTQEYNTILKYEMPVKEDKIDKSGKYTITYDTDGGSTVPSSQEAVITEVQKYNFAGWEQQPEELKGTLNTTNKEYTFPSDKDNIDTIKATYTPGEKTTTVEKVTLGAAPTKEGCIFVGWKSSKDDTIYDAGAEFTPSEDITFTAQWKEKK